MSEYTVKLFKGLKNDEDQKQIPPDYHYKMRNFNYSDTGILGIEQVLCPQRITDMSAKVDGIYEYRFLDANNNLVKQYIGVSGGVIYKNITSTRDILKTGLSTGKISFAVFNDRLYIANGKDYVTVYDGNKGVVSQMGAPLAEVQVAGGNPNGSYYYAITFLTAGGEEYVGSVSNTVAPVNRKVLLTLPIGYDGTLTRNIYRTEASGTTLKLLASVANNTDLTYTDNIADASLTTTIPAINNELPKPYILTVAFQKLIGGVVASYPTQLFISDTGIDVFNTANGTDISNYGDDNTAIQAVGSDFNNIVVGTNKNIYFVDCSGTTNTVSLTRANVGILNAYSMANIPSFGDFAGGLMFVSTQYDVRLIVGLNALPVSTSLDNIRTENWGQNVKGTLTSDLINAQNIYAAYYKYKYHLILDGMTYTFDVRTNGWSNIQYDTENYTGTPVVYGILNNRLYNGQEDGWLELEYAKLTYRTEDVKSWLESPLFDATDKFKFIESMKFYFMPTNTNDTNITVVTDTNERFNISADFKLSGGDFDSQDYSEKDYLVDLKGLDYKVVNIHRPCRWLKYILTNNSGNINFQGFTIVGDMIANKEG